MRKNSFRSLTSQVIRKKWSTEKVKNYIGDFQDAYFSYATDPELRKNAASGGSISAILLSLLKSGAIQGALVCKHRLEHGKVTPFYCIAQDQDGLLEAQGSRYIETHFADEALPMIQAFPGKLAVVALPCEAKQIRSYCENHPDVQQKIVCVLTPFCGHLSRSELTEGILNQLTKGSPDEIQEFVYRRGHWRGSLQVTMKDGTSISKPFSYFSDYQNLYFFCHPKCFHCCDQTGYFGDIGIGDVWIKEMQDNPIKHNALIVRTPQGQAAVQEAVNQGRLTLVDRSIEDICEGQARSMPTHYNISARAKAGKLLGMKIKDTQQQKVSFKEYLIALMLLFNAKFSSTPLGGKIVFKIPRFILKGYLYFYKLLETVGGSMSKPKQQMVISVIGGTISGNRGAEAMLATTIGMLRKEFPNAKFYAFSYYPGRDRKLLNAPNVAIKDSRPIKVVLNFCFALVAAFFALFHIRLPNKFLPSSLRAIRESDILLDVSGISFMDGREIFLPFNMLIDLPAMMLKVPVVKLSQAMGPFKNPINRMCANFMLKRCDYVFARGSETARNLETLPKVRNWKEAADITFLYEPEFTLSQENETRLEPVLAELEEIKAQGNKIAIFCPSSLVDKKTTEIGIDYVGQMLQLVQVLIEKNVHCVFVPNSNRQHTTKPTNNDIVVITKVKEAIQADPRLQSSKEITLIDFDINTQAIRRLFSLADILIASRFHAMISGLALGKPTLVIGWGHKYHETMAAFGQAEFEVRFNKANENLSGLVMDLLARQADIEKTLHQRLEQEKASAMVQFEYLKKRLS